MFDTSMAILRRKLNGRSIGKGDREHIHHLLRDRGLSSTKTLLAICGMCTMTAAAVLAATVLNQDWIAIAVCLALLATLIAGRVFGFNETKLLIDHLRAVGTFVRAVPRILRVKFVVVRLQGTLQAGRLDLWHKVVNRARRLDTLEIDFVCEHLPTGRKLARLAWNSPLDSESSAEFDSPVWQLNYTAPRGAGIQTRICARGLRRDSAGLASLNELCELLVALCDSWPIGDIPASSADEQRRAA
jgi:hypothetical protein